MLKYLFLTAALLVPATALADHRDNPKWIEYQSRMAARKAEARAKLAEIHADKNNSRVPLSYRLDVNVAMPHGHLYRNPPVMWWNWRRPAVIVIR